MNETPSSWAMTTLGEVTTIVSGSTPKTGVSEYWGGEIAWVTPDDLSKNRSKVVQAGARFLTTAGYDSCSTTLMPPGAVLYSSRAPIGYVAIAGGPVCTNQGFKSFVPTDVVSSDFLYWFLIRSTPEIRKLGSGTTFPELSKKSAATIPIPLPPLNEQRRIVAAIEEHLSRLDAADASLASVELRIRPIRSAILAQALGGPWPFARVGDVAEIASGPAFRSAFFGGPGEGVRLLRGENIEPGRLRWRDTRTWPENMLDGYEHLFVDASDLILAMDRPVISSGLKLAPVHPGDLPALLVQRVARIRPRQQVLTEFLHAALRLPRFIPHVVGDQTGTQLPHITLAGIRAFEIPLPPLDDQRRIVAEIEERLSRIDGLRAAIERAQRRSASLRRAILERAFRGELVPQDPADEPAEQLLARIRAGRATAESATGRRPRRRATMRES